MESQEAKKLEEMKYKIKSFCEDKYDREITWLKAKLEATSSTKD